MQNRVLFAPQLLHPNIMASPNSELKSDHLALLNQIDSTLQTILQDYKHLSAAVETIAGRVNILAGMKQVQDVTQDQNQVPNGHTAYIPQGPATSQSITRDPVSPNLPTSESVHEEHPHPLPARRSSTFSRIILTTYPGQSGIDPLAIAWGHTDPMQRGPVVVSRSQSTIRRRNGTS